MGAFGPRRVVTATDAHTPAAPYAIINNSASLLDATDLVFIDAPGTGFSRIAGKEKEKDKAFYGVDPDAHAFGEFIAQFLSKYGRWNSPKYLFGESYGTTRSAVLINQLETERAIDFNGVILLSQILNFDLSPDRPTSNPGVDLAYQTVLPTYAATAWYHHKLPAEHKDLESLLAELKTFALIAKSVERWEIRIERRGMLKWTLRGSRSGLLVSGDWTRRNGARRYGPWRWPKRMIRLNIRLMHSMSPHRLVLPRPPCPSWSRRPSMPRLTKVCYRRSDAAGSQASDVRIAAGMTFVRGARPVASLGIGAPTAARHSIR